MKKHCIENNFIHSTHVKIKKLYEDAKIPTYGSDFAACADLYAYLPNGEVLTIPPHETAKIKTGFAMEVKSGYCALVYARSGIATKRGLAPANCVGVIDSDYRGECMVALHNHSDYTQRIEPGERIAQMMIAPYYKAVFEEVDELSETQRGEGGFGSTGTK